ncbi:adhesion G protein-coupled receptor F4-like, partial [Enoplosus armatus]|uniref:adhesion G protein-coupled receptor F4-like n=1 Tax=Enoplosus armatus TaxID=215367 RepID=UPI00399595DF
CEEQFAWSCDKCNIYGVCSNATNQTCGCINGLPSGGEFCEPITNITQCPTSTPAPYSTTTPMMTTTTPMMTTAPNTTTTAMTTTTPNATTTPMMTTAPNTTTTAMTTTTPNTTTTPMMTTTTPMMTTTPNATTTPMMTTAPNTTTTPMMTTTTPMMTTTPNTTTTSMMTTTTPMMTTTPNATTTPMMTTAPNATTTPMTTTTPNATTTPMMTTTPNATTTPMTTTTPNATTTPMTTTTPNATTTPVMTTTTPMMTTAPTTTTTPVMTTTTPIMTTAPSTTTTPVMTTTTPMMTTTTTEERSLTLTMDMDFDSSYNDETSQVYKDTYDSIKKQCDQHILTLQTVKLNEFRSGSTIADYTIRATSFQETEIEAVKTGIFKQLAEKYPMLYDRLYECKLKNQQQTDKSVFRQKSKGSFFLKETPSIRVTPVRKNVKCEEGQQVQVQLQCSVNGPYEVKFEGNTAEDVNIIYPFNATCERGEKKFTCHEKTYKEFKEEITLMLFTETPDCEDPDFGDGIVGDKAIAPCEPDEVGNKTAICKTSRKWEDRQDNCILQVVQELLERSENLNNNSLPDFLEDLRNVTISLTEKVVNSSANINAIVEILNNIANSSLSLNIPITETSMKDILLTAGVLTTDGARKSWDTLNTNDAISETRSDSTTAESVSSTLLLALENIADGLTSDSFDIVTPSILLNKTRFTDTFNGDFNSSVEIDIPESDGRQKSITVITFASMDNVLPARDEDNSTLKVINGRVVLVKSSGTINNVSLTFDTLNNTLRNPQCVFWNFSLFDGLGGWDNEGCTLSYNNTVTCNCNHLTSFSILMSPYSPNDHVLDIISYTGVSISMASLVICLIIEAVIWRKIRKNNTSYLRHVSIVNIAVSLLIANIWFIIGAAISDPEKQNPPECSAATFFIHFFYLALFFWMLASALLLFYRTVSVFDGGLSKKSMLAIGFSLGYGAPLIIAIITIAVTEPRKEYIRGTGVCWLNWHESKALLAFVIPALLIVLINLVILLVVIYKMLRRRAVGDAAQAAERHVLVVIARSLAVLTPFFGLTWGLGVGTMTTPGERGIHISFAFFNSLQGFFILVFGTLLDKKVRSEIAMKSQTSGSGTRSTSAGISFSSGLGFFRNWRKGKDGYNMSSSASGESHSFTNT